MSRLVILAMLLVPALLGVARERTRVTGLEVVPEVESMTVLVNGMPTMLLGVRDTDLASVRDSLKTGEQWGRVMSWNHACGNRVARVAR